RRSTRVDYGSPAGGRTSVGLAYYSSAPDRTEGNPASHNNLVLLGSKLLSQYRVYWRRVRRIARSFRARLAHRHRCPSIYVRTFISLAADVLLDRPSITQIRAAADIVFGPVGVLHSKAMKESVRSCPAM